MLRSCHIDVVVGWLIFGAGFRRRPIFIPSTDRGARESLMAEGALTAAVRQLLCGDPHSEIASLKAEGVRDSPVGERPGGAGCSICLYPRR
jgi:hypothetical protein